MCFFRSHHECRGEVIEHRGWRNLPPKTSDFPTTRPSAKMETTFVVLPDLSGDDSSYSNGSDGRMITTRRMQRLFDAGIVIQFESRCNARTRQGCTCRFAQANTPTPSESAGAPTVNIYVHKFSPTQHYDYKEQVLRGVRNHDYKKAPLNAKVYKDASSPHSLVSLEVPCEAALREVLCISSDMYYQ